MAEFDDLGITFNEPPPGAGMALSTESSPPTEAFAKHDIVFGPEPTKPQAEITPPPLEQTVFSEPELKDYPGPATDYITYDLDHQTSSLWANAKSAEDPLLYKNEIARSVSRNPDLPTVDDVAEEQEAPWYTTIFGILDAFDIPRREAWNAAYLIGSALPDPSTEDSTTLLSSAGDMLSYLTEKSVAFGFGFNQVGDDDKHDESLELLGANLYKAIATGGLYEKGQKHRGEYWDTDTPLGIHVLDSVIPKDLALKLHDTSGVGPKTAIYKALTTDVGRIGIGLAMEVALDPLWFAGPAKGAQVVNVGNTAYRASGTLTRAAGIASKHMNEIGAGSGWVRKGIKLVTGGGDDVKDVKEAFELAANVADSAAKIERTKVARLTRLADQAKSPETLELAVKGLDDAIADEVRILEAQLKLFGDTPGVKAKVAARQSKIAKLNQEREVLSASKDAAKTRKSLINLAKKMDITAKSHAADAEGIRRFVRLADGAATPKQMDSLVKETRGLAFPMTWHIPFTDKSAELMTKTQVEKAGKYISGALDEDSILLTALSKASKWENPLSDVVINKNITKAREAKLGDYHYLSRGQTLYEALRQTVGKPAVVASGAAWDFAAKYLGGRLIQPRVAWLSAQSEMLHYGGRGAFMMQLPWSSKYIMGVRKVAPDVWQKYHDEVTNYMRVFRAHETELMGEVERIYRTANDIIPEYRGWVKKRLPELTSEVASLRATLAGRMNDAERLEVAQKIRTIEHEMKGLSEVLEDDYNAVALVNHVADLRERGASTFKRNPWLSVMEGKVDELVTKFADLLGEEKLLVQEALVAMSRFGMGDKLASDELVRIIDHTLQMVNDAPIERAAEVSMDSVRQHILMKANFKMKLLRRVSKDALAEIIYKTREIVGERPFNDETAIAIRNTLIEILGGNRSLADEILTYASGAYGEGNPELALSFFAKDITGDLVIADVRKAGLDTPKPTVASTDTPEFKAWLGKSTVSDVFYHGTTNPVVDKDFVFSGSPSAGGLIYFDKRPGIASEYATGERVGWLGMGDAESALNMKLVRERNLHLFDGIYLKPGTTKEQVSDIVFDADVSSALLDDMSNLTAPEAVAAFNKLVDEYTISGAIMPVYLRVERPYNSPHKPISFDEAEEIGAHRFQELGFDGVYVKEGKGSALAVFHPNQIKSKFNPGTFSKTDLRLMDDGWIRKLNPEPSTGIHKRFTRNQIVRSIDDKITESNGTITKLKEVEKGDLGRQVGMFTPRELLEDELLSLQHQKIDRFRSRLSAKVEDFAARDDFLASFLPWVRAEYPKGVPILDSVGNKVATTSAQWLKANAKFQGTLSAKDIEGLRRSYVSILRMEGEADSVVTTLTSAVERAKNAKGVKGSIFSKRELRYQARMLHDKRVSDALKHLVVGAPDEAEAIRRIRAVLDQLVDPKGNEILQRMNASMSSRLAKSIMKGDDAKAALSQARTEARGVAKAGVKELQKKLEQQIPRLRIPIPKKSRSLIRDLQDWELQMWDEFTTLTSQLTQEETMLAAYTALKRAPKLITEDTVGAELLTKIKDRYHHVLGSRFDDVPETLEPLVKVFDDFIEKYEDLYVKHGMHFTKKPEDMMRFWGVVDYVPHMSVPAEVIAKGGYSASVVDRHGSMNIGSRLEDRIATDMDQRKMRVISGTMSEINNLTSNPAITFTVDPTALFSRYFSAVRSMSAQDFMFALMQGKVVKAIRPRTAYEHELDFIAGKYAIPSESKDIERLVREVASPIEIRTLDDIAAQPEQIVSMTQVAKDLDYVPLFDNVVPKLALDLLVEEGAVAWREAGVNFDEVFKAVKVFKENFDPFATWTREIPELQQGDNILQILLSIKADDFKNGIELFNPVSAKSQAMGRRTKELIKTLTSQGLDTTEVSLKVAKNHKALSLGAWKDVAKQMNQRSLDLNVGVKINNGEMLQTFFEQGREMWRLYVPRGVSRSMSDLFVFSEKAKSPMYKFFQGVNNFWKTRVTVMAAAFSARNHLSNKFSQILDTGLATLSPRISYDAGSLSMLSALQEKYGSIESAKKMLRAPKREFETTFAYSRRQAEAKFLDVVDANDGVFDLGDGVFRSTDEALNILKEKGVISGAFTQYVDIDQFERGLSEIMYYGGVKQDWDKVKKFASWSEDALVMGLPALMTGGFYPIGLSKHLGQYVSRHVENHARIGTFIANTRRSGSFDVAADHVDRFLFNYGDLTGAQKVWMRLFIPFFTWSQKNVALNLKMMQENPVFYSQFNRILMKDGPEMAEAYRAEIAGEQYVPLQMSKPSEVKYREPHTRNLVRFPLPGHKGAFIEGFGLPMEAFAETVGMLATTAQPSKWLLRYDDRKPAMRLLGQMHFLMKMGIELTTQHNAFYDRPLSELTSGRIVAQQIAAVRKLPLVGDLMAEQMVNATGLRVSQSYNHRLGMWTDDIRVSAMPNYFMGNLPWVRVMRDAAAASMAYHFSILNTSPQSFDADVDKQDPIDDAWRITDAMTGIRIVNDDPWFRRKLYQYRLNKAHATMLERSGFTRQHSLEFPRNKP